MRKKRESREFFVNVVKKTLRMRYDTDVKSLSESTPTRRKNCCLGVLTYCLAWLEKFSGFFKYNTKIFMKQIDSKSAKDGLDRFPNSV